MKKGTFVWLAVCAAFLVPKATLASNTINTIIEQIEWANEAAEVGLISYEKADEIKSAWIANIELCDNDDCGVEICEEYEEALPANIFSDWLYGDFLRNNEFCPDGYHSIPSMRAACVDVYNECLCSALCIYRAALCQGFSEEIAHQIYEQRADICIDALRVCLVCYVNP